MSLAFPHKGGWGTDVALESIAKKLQRGNVLLVLGAGVSMFYGLPNWKDLLAGIRCDGTGHTLPEISDDYPRWAQNILDDLFGGDEKKFSEAISEALYGSPTKEIDTERIRHNETLRSICAIGTDSMRGKTDSIVTFNYDSLLESYFESDGLVVQPVTSENQPWESADITIFHPHGFLPHRESRFKRSENIVLATCQYDRSVSSHWESILENLFSTRFCLFVGLSGEDKRLESILSKVKNRNQHAKVENYWGYRICGKGDRKIDMWESNHVFSLEVDELGLKIPETILKICQTAAQGAR
ncbi:MAG: SIR2 family protein [Hyphomicrobiales bacterium]|nr:SIR2 family protein [Hyphomicrobiales bacterium]